MFTIIILTTAFCIGVIHLIPALLLYICSWMDRCHWAAALERAAAREQLFIAEQRELEEALQSLYAIPIAVRAGYVDCSLTVVH